MSEPTTASSSDLGPMPDPAVEPGEPAPGGPDALHGDGGEVVPADLPPEANPAVDTTSMPVVGEGISGGEDTSTEATREDDPDAGAEVDKENPA